MVVGKGEGEPPGVLNTKISELICKYIRTIKVHTSHTAIEAIGGLNLPSSGDAPPLRKKCILGRGKMAHQSIDASISTFKSA